MEREGDVADGKAVAMFSLRIEAAKTKPIAWLISC
jgi:hypothetical protein